MPERFRLSFTAASLFLSDMALLAHSVIAAEGDWNQLTGELLSRNRQKSNKRELTELVLRLKTLSNEELELLAFGNLEDQKQISLIAFGRTYTFFRFFLLEVVLRKLDALDHQLSDMDYWTYFSSKELTHPELTELAETTREKLRQVMFKVMEQGGMIDSVKSKRICPPLLTSSVRAMLEANDWQDAELLLTQTKNPTS